MRKRWQEVVWRTVDEDRPRAGAEHCFRARDEGVGRHQDLVQRVPSARASDAEALEGQQKRFGTRPHGHGLAAMQQRRQPRLQSLDLRPEDVRAAAQHGGEGLGQARRHRFGGSRRPEQRDFHACSIWQARVTATRPSAPDATWLA
jgi:hypothetical protein